MREVCAHHQDHVASSHPQNLKPPQQSLMLLIARMTYRSTASCEPPLHDPSAWSLQGRNSEDQG